MRRASNGTLEWYNQSGMLNQVLAIGLGVSTIVLTNATHSSACSFGPLDNVKRGNTLEEVFNLMYHSCGGSVTVNRECSIEGCDETERRLGQQFQICSDGGRDSASKCVLLRDGKVVDTGK